MFAQTLSSNSCCSSLCNLNNSAHTARTRLTKVLDTNDADGNDEITQQQRADVATAISQHSNLQLWSTNGGMNIRTNAAYDNKRLKRRRTHKQCALYKYVVYICVYVCMRCDDDEIHEKKRATATTVDEQLNAKCAVLS